MVGMTRPGAFAEFMSIPTSSLIDIPQDMDARAAALTEPAATALARDPSRVEVAGAAARRRAEVLVIGGGAIGLLAALLLGHWGVRVTLAEVNPLRRASAAKHAALPHARPARGRGLRRERAIRSSSTRSAPRSRATPR